MAKEKAKTPEIEREYIINLRSELLKVPRYRRTPKAVKAIKQFIARHMKIVDHDTTKVKLDRFLNEELWFRGIQNPPTKIKVKAKKEGEFVMVSLAEVPQIVQYKIDRENKVKEKSQKIKSEKKKAEEPVKKEAEEKSSEEKTEEKEKEQAVKEAELESTKIKAKEQKHAQKVKPAKTERIQRKALQK